MGDHEADGREDLSRGGGTRFVLRVSPPLRDYVSSARQTWSEIVEGANRLRQQLGISRPAWIEACQVLGRYQAATAVSIIAAKRDTIRSPGGYLRGMTARARDGELYLLRSLHGLAEAQVNKSEQSGVSEQE